jgi:hypothetical protein
VLVVVESTGSGEAAELVAAFDGVAPVVVKPGGDGDRSLHDAFDVDGYPTYLEIDGDAVRQVLPSMTEVAAPPHPAAV